MVASGLGGGGRDVDGGGDDEEGAEAEGAGAWRCCQEGSQGKHQK